MLEEIVSYITLFIGAFCFGFALASYLCERKFRK